MKYRVGQGKLASIGLIYASLRIGSANVMGVSWTQVTVAASVYRRSRSWRIRSGRPPPPTSHAKTEWSFCDVSCARLFVISLGLDSWAGGETVRDSDSMETREAVEMGYKGQLAGARTEIRYSGACWKGSTRRRGF